MTNNPVQEGMNAYYSRDPEALKRVLEQLTSAGVQATVRSEPFKGPKEGCEHDWQIWPETDGQEQRCMKCGSYRRTPAGVNACRIDQFSSRVCERGTAGCTVSHGVETTRGGEQ